MKKSFFAFLFVFSFAVSAMAIGRVNCNSFYNIKFGTAEKKALEHMENSGWYLVEKESLGPNVVGYTFTCDGGEYAGLPVEEIFLRFYNDKLCWGSVTFNQSVTENQLSMLISDIISEYESFVTEEEYVIYNGYENTGSPWFGLSWESVLNESNSAMEPIYDYEFDYEDYD